MFGLYKRSVCKRVYIHASSALTPFSLHLSISWKSLAVPPHSPSSFQPPPSCPPPLYPSGRPPHSCWLHSSQTIPAPNPAALVQPFRVWISESKEIWDIKNQRNRGFGVGFLPFLRSLLLKLEAVHTRGLFHGKLMEGVYVNRDNRAELTNFSNAKWTLAYGMKQDLICLGQLIEIAISEHPPPNEVPYSVKSFLDLYKDFHLHSDMTSLRRIAFCIYHGPIAWDWSMRYSYVRKWWILYRTDQPHFETFLIDDENDVKIPELENWPRLLVPDTELFRIYMYSVVGKRGHGNQPKRRMEHSAGILFFFRNVYEHYCFGENTNFSIRNIESQLYDLFPEACARLFVLFDSGIRGRTIPVPDGKISLLEFYKREPYRF